MPNIRSANLLWVLICALALIIGLVAGRMGFAGQPPNTLSLANFRADFPLKQIQTKTFKNETVQLDGNEFIDCTFDNVVFKFDGQAPFRLTNGHFHTPAKFGVTSDNPVVKATIEIMSLFLKLETQNKPNENK